MSAVSFDPAIMQFLKDRGVNPASPLGRQIISSNPAPVQGPPIPPNLQPKNSWDYALSGQLPPRSTYAFPPGQENSAGMNILRGLVSSALQMPQTATALYQKYIGLPAVDFLATPEKDVEQVQNERKGIVIDPFETKAKGKAQDKVGFNVNSYVQDGFAALNPKEKNISIPGYTNPPEPPVLPIPVIPAAPQFEAPPSAPVIPAPDFSQQNQFLEAARPTGVDAQKLANAKMMTILAGLGQGLASVDASKPGQIGRMWAAMAGGGLGGMAQGANLDLETDQQNKKEMQQYNLTRANASFSQTQSLQANAAQNAQIAQNNAMAIYKTNVDNTMRKYEIDVKNAIAEMETDAKNKENMYKFNQQAWQFAQPKILSSEGGNLVVQNFNPETKSLDIKVLPSSSISKSLDEMMKMNTLMGGDKGASTPISQAFKYGYLAKNLEPQMANIQIRKEVVSDVIKNGGGMIFGEAYKKALKDAQAEMAMLAGRPEYNKEVEERVANTLFTSFMNANSFDWLKAALPYSFGAKLLLGATDEQP